MANPPTGTVTFLFTNIEGSTKLWEDYPARMAEALERHDEILTSAVEDHEGYVFKTVGDAFCAAFSHPRKALCTALDAQHDAKASKKTITATDPSGVRSRFGYQNRDTVASR